jgi:hypothetical protein
MYWYALLEAWRRSTRDGFTFPFVIGSQQFLRSDHEWQDIRALLTDIVENAPEPMYIKYCMDTDDLIIGLKKNVIGYYPTFKGAQQVNLYVAKFNDDLGQSVEDVIDQLEERYDRYIKNEEYSMNDGHRGNYSDREIKFIRESFMEG